MHLSTIGTHTKIPARRPAAPTRHWPRHALAGATLVLGLALAGCGDNDNEVSAAPAVPSCEAEQAQAQATLEIELGECAANEECAARARGRCEQKLAQLGCDDGLCRSALLGATCPVDAGAQVLDELLVDLTPVLNAAWPPAAKALGLDPYSPVWSGSISLPCEYGGDEICGLQASSCDHEYADVTVSSITGLSQLQFEDLHVLNVADRLFDVSTHQAGTPAPQVVDGTSAPEGTAWNDANFAVVLAGTGLAHGLVVDLGTTMTLDTATLQADGNDTYIIESSLDGKTSDIWVTFGPDPAGPGLRTMQSPTVETTARYLFVYAYQGDGNYSVAEVIPRVAGGGAVAPASMRAHVTPVHPKLTDGIVAPEGTAWDDATYVDKLNGGIQYGIVVDLGAPLPIRQLTIQADGAAEFYVYVNPTAAGAPPFGYEQWLTVPTAASGLRTRTLHTLAPVTARAVLVASADIGKVTSISEVTVFATDGTAIPGCPYGGAAEAYGCSYSGTAGAHAVTVSGGTITAKITTAKVKAKCTAFGFGPSFTETIFDAGSITCTAREPNGSAVANICGGVCTTGLPIQSISYLALDQLDLSVDDLSCEVGAFPDWVTDLLVPAVKSAVIDAIEPPIQDALNDVVGDYVPFPTMCEVPGS